MPLDRIISIARPGSSELFRYARTPGADTSSIRAAVTLKSAAEPGDRLLHLQSVPAADGAVPPVIGAAAPGDVVQFAGQQYDLTTLDPPTTDRDQYAIRFNSVPWLAPVVSTSPLTYAMGIFGSRAASALGSGRTWVGAPQPALPRPGPEETLEFLNFSSAWWTGASVFLPQGTRDFSFANPRVYTPHYDLIGPYQSVTVENTPQVLAELVSNDFRQTNGIFDELDIGSEDFPTDTPFKGNLLFQVPPGDPMSSVTQEAVAILRRTISDGAPAGSHITFVSASGAPKIWAQQLSFRTTQDVTLTPDNQALEVDEQVSEWRISARQSVGIDTHAVMIDDGGHVWDIRGIDQENDVRYARLFCQRTL